jgi:hypothetical protein
VSSAPDLYALARALGGEVVLVRGTEQILAPGANHSASDRSLSIRFTPRGLLKLHSFANDDLKPERARLKALLGKGKATARRTAPRARTLPTPKPNTTALWLWREAFDPRGTRVQRYLENCRGVYLPDGAANTAIRYDLHHRFRWEVVPAMLALIRHIGSDQPQAIHRTALSWADGNYSVGGDKRLALGPVAGGAVKLTPHEQVGDELGIGEGIESSLSLLMLDHGPPAVWSLISASGISGFPVLPEVNRLHIAVDHDPAGEKAAEACAARWTKAGKEVVLHRATTPGGDLNDVIRRGSA